MPPPPTFAILKIIITYSACCTFMDLWWRNSLNTTPSQYIVISLGRPDILLLNLKYYYYYRVRDTSTYAIIRTRSTDELA